MHRRRFDPAKFRKLDDPHRETYMPLEEVLGLLHLQPSMTVADLGAGTGYFSFPIARTIHPGTFYAVDVSPEMLGFIREKLQSADAPENLEPVLGTLECTGLPEDSVDAALCVNVWHEVEDRRVALREAARILRPGGGFVVVDWRADVERGDLGPPLEERLPVADVASEFSAEGWTEVRSGYLGLASFYVTAISPH